MLKRTFAISDIHGCYKTFESLLNKIGLNLDDELYLLGDYIDRGPYSKKVLDYILRLNKAGYNLSCLRGNHEQMMLEAPLNEKYAAIWLRNGGKEVLEEFSAEDFSGIPKIYYNFLDELKYFDQKYNTLFVHAGFKLGTDNDPFTLKQPLLWIREWEKQDGVEVFLKGRNVVHGHCPQTEFEIKKRVDNPDIFPILNIDNGCTYDREGMKQLCCVELNERTVYFQKNLDMQFQ